MEERVKEKRRDSQCRKSKSVPEMYAWFTYKALHNLTLEISKRMKECPFAQSRLEVL